MEMAMAGGPDHVRTLSRPVTLFTSRSSPKIPSTALELWFSWKRTVSIYIKILLTAVFTGQGVIIH